MKIRGATFITKAFIGLACIILMNDVSAQNIFSTYKALHSQSYLQDRNFYLFTLFDKLPQVNNILAHDTLFMRISRQKEAGIKDLSACRETKCLAANFSWTDDETKQIGNELNKLVHSKPALSALVKAHLRASGKYIIYNNLDDGQLLEQAWVDAATGINNIINTYALGVKPRYPDIDSVTYNTTSKAYLSLVRSAAVAASANKKSLFYQPPLGFALALLKINHRDEAARFEPLGKTQNSAVINFIHNINWKDYPYSVLIVPGAGNELPNVRLSALGKSRLQTAVNNYKKHLAPLIAVSGGYVHPFQTPYCEAIEMKAYLMSYYHIPAKAILVEPYARHTTTNLRNVNRLIFRYNIPLNKKALIATNAIQSLYMEDSIFTKKCQAEMKCIPFQDLKMTPAFSLEFLPTINSLYENSMDPLDP